MLSVMPETPIDDWYVLIGADVNMFRRSPARYRVVVYEPGHKVFESRTFINPAQANEWADSWGLPRRLTQHV